MARVRNRETIHTAGTRQRMLLGTLVVDHSQTNPPYQQLIRKDECEDELGRHKDHACKIEHYNLLMAPLNGFDDVAPTSWRRYTNWQPNLAAPAHMLIPQLPSIGVSATKLRLESNPGRAHVSLPVFFGEMRDLPHAIRGIRDIGQQLLKRKRPRVKHVSGQYLSWEFGWKPLMSDLRKIIQFQETFDKRVIELERLYTKGGLKRRLTLFDGTVQDEANATIESALGTLVTTRRTRITSVKRWGTIRWLPTSLPPKSQKELQRLARKAVFGISIQASDVWNLIPWTWLIDWASNAGDYLEAHNNRVPCYAKPCNIMTYRITNTSWTRTDKLTWLSGGGGVAIYETKERSLSSGTLSATFPFLSGRQLSILGALATTRFRGSWRF